MGRKKELLGALGEFQELGKDFDNGLRILVSIRDDYVLLKNLPPIYIFFAFVEECVSLKFRIVLGEFCNYPLSLYFSLVSIVSYNFP